MNKSPLGLVRAGLVAGAVLLGVTTMVTNSWAMPYDRGGGAPVAAAAQTQTTPTVQATLTDNWLGVDKVPAGLRYEFTSQPHYTLDVKGTSFVPGSTVRIALLDTATLKVIYRGLTTVEPATIFDENQHEGVPNPLAGTFEYRASINVGQLTLAPQVWVKAPHITTIHAAAMQ